MPTYTYSTMVPHPSIYAVLRSGKCIRPAMMKAYDPVVQILSWSIWALCHIEPQNFTAPESAIESETPKHTTFEEKSFHPTVKLKLTKSYSLFVSRYFLQEEYTSSTCLFVISWFAWLPTRQMIVISLLLFFLFAIAMQRLLL